MVVYSPFRAFSVVAFLLRLYENGKNLQNGADYFRMLKTNYLPANDDKNLKIKFQKD
jgi:hypothetical protein